MTAEEMTEERWSNISEILLKRWTASQKIPNAEALCQELFEYAKKLRYYTKDVTKEISRLRENERIHLAEIRRKHGM